MATNEKNDLIVGIDFGTTYSSIAIYDDSPKIIISELGETIIPSYVVFEDEEKIYVGEMAKLKSESKAMVSIFDIKRLIGKKYSDLQVKEDLKKWPFEVFEDSETKKAKIRVKIKKVNNCPPEINPNLNVPLNPISRDNNINKFNVNIPLNAYSNENDIPKIEKEFFPEEIASYIIKKLKEYAEADLKRTINRAIITVPAYFNDCEKEATKLAGEMAGLTIERIIKEPTAAALAYGLDNNSDIEKYILVFDLGGGTFDVTLLKLDFQESNKIFEVIAINGNTHLGGKDFDFRLLEKCIEHFNNENEQNQIDLIKFPNVKTRLLKECEKAKILLSEKNSVTIKVDKLIFGKDFEIQFTKEQFENYCKDLFDSCIPYIEKVINDGKKCDKNLNISDIVLVGGSTKIPYIKEMLQKKYSNAIIYDKIDPNQAVALGACIQGGIINHKPKLNKITLLDINPMSLGIRIINDTFSMVIKKYSSIPKREKKEFFTSFDNQEKCTIEVYEGENKNINNNYLLGSFDLTNLPKLPKGEAKVEVTFDIDVNSILTVSAEDKSNTKNKNKITIINNKGIIDENEIERIKSRINDLEDYNRNINLKNYRVLINDIKTLKKLIFITSDKRQKYEYQKKLIKSFETYLNTFNLENNENEALIEKIAIYTELLIKEYASILSNEFIENEIIFEIKKILYKYINIILKYEKCSIFSILEPLRINKEIYDFCAIFRIVELFVQGKKLFDIYINNSNLNEKEKQEKIKTTIKIFNDLNNEKKGIKKQLDFYFIEEDFERKIKEYLKKSKIYLIKIEIKIIINRANYYLKNAIDKNNNLINLRDINSAYSEYNTAIQKNLNNENKIYDRKDYDYCNQQINKILLLKTKNNSKYNPIFVKIEQILKEKKKIDDENNHYVEEYIENDKERFKKFKEKLESKMKYLKEDFENTAINAIKLILNEYPQQNFNQLNIEKEFKENPSKYLRKLKADFHPDHYEDKQIPNEIFVHLNNINDNLYI